MYNSVLVLLHNPFPLNNMYKILPVL